MATVVSSMQEQALKRKERLKALRQKNLLNFLKMGMILSSEATGQFKSGRKGRDCLS